MMNLLRASAILCVSAGLVVTAKTQTAGYDDLVRLFGEFQTFEKPALKNGAPDYSPAAVTERTQLLKAMQTRLAALNPASWPIDQRIDHALVKAQLDGMDFDLRVLKPFARDPAYYQSIWTEQSDTPAHEGPTHHAIIDLWTYAFPLSPADQTKLAGQLATIPPLLAQARVNLVGNARDLWVTGTETMQGQVADLDAFAQAAVNASPALKDATQKAKTATEEFVAWLRKMAPTKTGPSGIGKAAYTAMLKNVHLVPMTWDDEVALLKRELARAHASLKLEEQRNRGLPPLTAVANDQEYQQRAGAAITKYIAWLGKNEILTVQPYLDGAMRAHIGGFVPLERRAFFSIANHYEPMALFAHFYHWFDHAWMKNLPVASPIRRGATRFNVWDNRSEGMATAMEEIILHAGYYDDNPRAREIVWIMLAQRCARGLASLYAQANEFDIAQAKAFQVEWTPRQWMRPDLDLLNFEQQLYLRQPGYGSSYVTGKYLIDELIKDRAHQVGDAFTLKRFFDEFNGAGVIPVSLIRWQLTGK
ncbi:MAG TPA: DUF885 family protein [Vicinamibacterales bacterium]|nr:DUF885 family protein [Vicinamibacterales bacterium]